MPFATVFSSQHLAASKGAEEDELAGLAGDKISGTAKRVSSKNVNVGNDSGVKYNGCSNSIYLKRE